MDCNQIEKLRTDVGSIFRDMSTEWREVAPRLSMRRYGNTPHFQLRGNSAGGDGEILIHVEDIEIIARTFVRLCELLPTPEPEPEEVKEEVVLEDPQE